MIFVTVGTHSQNFNRLVSAADDLVNYLNEEIVIQYGYSTHNLKFAKGFSFATAFQICELIRSSRAVICQAAAGSILTAAKEGKPIILVPRLKKYHENHTNHQIELGIALQEANKAVYLQEVSSKLLAEAIPKAISLNATFLGPQKLILALHAQIKHWCE